MGSVRHTVCRRTANVNAATNDAAPSTDGNQEGKETSKTRRRGRRGGRRRRKDNQATTDAPNGNDQSTRDDFDDEDGEHNGRNHERHESGSKPTPSVARADGTDNGQPPKILDAVEAVNDAPITGSTTAPARASEIPVPAAGNTNAHEVAATQSTVDASVDKVETGATAPAAPPRAELANHSTESVTSNNQQDLPLSSPSNVEPLASKVDEAAHADAAEVAPSERATPNAHS